MLHKLGLNKSHKWRVMSYLLILFVLSACAVTDKPAIDLPPLTLSAPPTPVFEGSCDESRSLETWLQTVDFQERDFVQLMTGADRRSYEELYFDVEQMARLRDRVSATVAPDCAMEAHTLLLSLMAEVLDSYQASVNGDDVDLSEVIDEFTPQFENYEALQRALVQRLGG